MPEGLDQARSAFQQAISPQAIQPRDDSGRFAQTSKPETMFAPRPLEGDPLTGDTRDAGENPRLADMERRIADGRAQEGDEEFSPGASPRSGRGSAAQERTGRQRVQDGDREGARHAGADEGHHLTEAEQAEQRGRKSEQQDTDPERSQGDDAEAGQGDADGDAERNAEAEDGQKYEINVDGETREVSLGEALKGYIREQTFHKRMSQVDQARSAIEQEAGNIGQARDAYIAKLQYADRLIADLTPQEPNWDQEFVKDPRAAHEMQKTYAAIYQKRHLIDQELQRAQAEGQTEYDRRSKDYAIREFSNFVADAKIPDEKALNEALTMMRAYGRKEGFSEAELASTYDRRMLKVLRKAALYDQQQGFKPKPVQPGQGKALTPGVATPVGNATRRHIDEAQSRLAKTGRLDDAASVMARLIR
jgi:hypothetical protein